MAKLIYYAISSLDGYVEDADGKFDWAEPDEEVHAFVNNLVRPVGTYLFGRRMYETMVFWERPPDLAAQPPVVQDFAEIWQRAEKIVYSKTLQTASSARTRIEREFNPGAVRQLKATVGRDLAVGGAELAAQAIEAGLIDEYHLLLVPVVVGGGKRSLPDRNVRVKLELLDERRFRNGTMYLHYRTAGRRRERALRGRMAIGSGHVGRRLRDHQLLERQHATAVASSQSLQEPRVLQSLRRGAGLRWFRRSQTRKGDALSATVLYMSMSLDGFVAGPNEGPGNGLGDGGHRLHEWSLTGADADRKAISGRQAGVNGQVVDEFMATGAVVAGRGTVEPAGYWGGDHHDGVPIFVLSRREPEGEMGQWPLVTYVNDVRTAMNEAKRAAGGKNVLVHGAGTAQLALTAGVLDELEIHLIPVLLGQGRRLFDNLDPEHIELERTRILEGEAGVTHMHYRVQR